MKAHITTTELKKIMHTGHKAMDRAIDNMTNEEMSEVLACAFKLNPAAATMAMATLTKEERKALLDM